MAFPGMGGGMGGGMMGGSGMLGGANATAGLSDEKIKEMQMVKAMNAAMESCVGKSAVSGVMGFGLGGMFGLFMSSMRYDTSMSTQSEAVSKLPVREQLKTGFRDMGKSSWSSAKNFGKVALLFTGIECGIEGYRGKNAIENNVAAGCGAGAILARNAGPQAMLVGCAGFAAFSAAIETYMHMDSNDPAREPIT